MRIVVSRVDPSLPLPTQATPGSVGLDLYCRESVTIEPGGIARIPANVIVHVPPGHVLLIVLRSGTPRRTGLISPGGVGVIDQDFHGPEDEIQVQVFNTAASAVSVQRGDRIAQALLMPVVPVEWQEQPAAGDGTSRGGFGSTG